LQFQRCDDIIIFRRWMMREITRREFIKGLGGLGLCALGGALLSCAKREPTPTKPPPLPPNAREARYYREIGEGLVQCQLCPNRCTLPEGVRSPCRVRENRGGKLYTLVYGNPCAVHNDPMEKKPFFHFLPASFAFSIATAGCNLHCLYCQNWTISQVPPEETKNYDLPPEEVVELALKHGAQSIAYTYSEPTIFYEYMLDVAKVARERGLKNVVISAGYINPKPLKELCKAVDAIKIDLKGFDEDFYENVCFARLEPVLEAIKTIYQAGIHLEIVNLVVPTLNDDKEQLRDLARWIVENVGPDVPTHFSRFYPMYKLKNLPMTPVESLERARNVAIEEGLRFVYIGNVPGHEGNHTFCPNCGKPIIVRMGFAVIENRIKEGKCEFCGEPIPGVWGEAKAPLEGGQFGQRKTE
jgi:pyruvate formate lyase activating enzyme